MAHLLLNHSQLFKMSPPAHLQAKKPPEAKKKWQQKATKKGF
jgi:hypothetical protein